MPGSFDNLPIAGLLVTLDGTIVSANRAAGRLTERDVTGLAGMRVAQLAPALAHRWDALIADVRAHGQAVDEVALESPRRDLQITLSLAGDLVQCFAVDITARKAAEDAATQQRLDSLGLVAGGIAHDFNNLLVGVLAEASAAREEPGLGEPTREALRRIEGAARRMAQLTRQLLAYSGRAQLVTTAVAPDEIVGELRDDLVRGMRAGIELVVTPGARGAVVEGDVGLLRQVVVQLVANAADAARSRVGFASRLVSRDGAPAWQLEVSDDGAGVDSATLARIFEPFFSTKPGHHGLGLSMVHGVARRLGGEVDVDTRAGGSVFRVQLPIALGVEPARRLSTEAIRPIPRLTGIRVLVADDEPSVRATVRRLLERRGATVVVASDGLEAEARLRDEQFHLVVSDVMMPGCTGYDVLVTARATQPGVRVVLMSGYTEQSRGADEPDAFVEKPFTAKALDSAIDNVLSGRGA